MTDLFRFPTLILPIRHVRYLPLPQINPLKSEYVKSFGDFLRLNSNHFDKTSEILSTPTRFPNSHLPSLSQFIKPFRHLLSLSKSPQLPSISLMTNLFLLF